MKNLLFIGSLFVSLNLNSSELKLSLQDPTSHVDPNGIKIYNIWVNIEYKGPATNRWAVRFIPSDTPNGQPWFGEGLFETNSITQTNYYPFNKMLWFISSTNASAFFRANLIEEK